MTPAAVFRVLALLISAMHTSIFAFDVIAHRGASGYLPEHTLEAAVLAHGQSPTYIEQDVVLSADGIPIVLHDIHLETVTDVETVFPDRKRNDGRWYAIDFTLSELKQLRVHERQSKEGRSVYPNRYQGLGHFTIATLEEHLSTLLSLNRSTGQNIGFYPEIKSPSFHHSEGQDLSKAVIALLEKYGLNNPDANIVVQCFDFAEVKRLRIELGLKIKLVQLIGENSWKESTTDYEWLRSKAGLVEMSRYVDGIGPWLNHVFDFDNSQSSLKPLQWVKEAQKLGLVIHPYTFRADSLPKGVDAKTLLNALVDGGIDGVFTDHVPHVKQIVDNEP